jgi:hypothetical protein
MGELDPLPDGSSRVRHDEPPLLELERGPVWVIDVARGHRELVASRACLVERDGEATLVLYEGETLLAVMAMSDIACYETVRIDDPTAEVRCRRPWAGLAAGDELTLVHAGPGTCD